MWNPKIIDTDKVLYIAIADAIERDIALGILKANEKMPAQRSLAKIIGVNLTTISRAYKEAQRRGLISGSVGSGTFVLQEDKVNNILPDMLKNRDEIIEFGLVGGIKLDGYDLSGLLKELAEAPVLDALLDYAPSQGLLRHRQVAAKWLHQYDMAVDPSRIVITAGTMHAINCALLGLFEPGDKIAVDELTFTGFKHAAQLHGIKLEPVTMDLEGMLPESLETLCKKQSIKGIYLMPNMQNPTASVMSEERKRAIADIIRQHDLILLEDDIYNFTNLKHRKALTSLVPEQGIFICGTSKVFFPGLRVAFTVIPKAFLNKFTQGVTATVWMAPTLSVELVTRLIETGLAEQLINEKRRLIARRLKFAKEVLKDFEFQVAENSVFFWLDLPEEWSCSDFENSALTHKVRVISAHKFCVGHHLARNGVRISLGAVENDEELIQGLTILHNLLKEDSSFALPIM